MSDLGRAVVLVTPRSFPDADPEALATLDRSVGEVRLNRRGRALTSAELREELADVDGMIAGLDALDAAAFEAAPRLRAVARYGTGVDRVDVEAARRAGVVVTNTPGANADAVAELAIALMLALARSLPVAERRARAGEWRAPAGIQLAGRTVGLLGLGRIGGAVAKRARCLGCQVVAHDPAVQTEAARAQGVEPAALDEVVERAQVLSLHVPLTPDTRDLVGRSLLERLPAGVLLVNTARGELVVEEDLLAALESGRVAGAALDTLREEPPDPDHPLLHREDVIVTPHIGGHTAEARAAMARESVAELLAVLSGRRPRFPVVPEPAAGGARP